jgi:CheY-like chemotaxis protein
MNTPRTHILLVDDDEQVLMNLAAYLVDEGFLVATAQDGASALALVRHIRFRAALVDLRMPGMDGFRFMTEARRIDPELRYLVVTGSPDHILPADLLAQGLGAHQVIRKPIRDMDEITQAVLALLQGVT